MMTMRERMLALVQGRPHDRVPFVQYTGIAAPNEDIWSVIGRENMGLLSWLDIHSFETPNCQFVTEGIERDGREGFRTTLHTPEGSLFEERFFEPVFHTTATSVHYVKEVEDYRVLLAYFRDIIVHKFPGELHRIVRVFGEDGLPHVSLPKTPYQQLWVLWVSLQDLPIHLAMYPEVMEEVMAVMFDVQTRVFKMACEMVIEGEPIPYINIGDNITAPAIGEAYFRQYCLPSYLELANMLAETGKDIPIFVHMDGDLKALTSAISESPVRGLDSFSPPPDNDLSVAEAVALWPEMRLGLNFPSSVHLAQPEEIYQCATRILEEGGRTGRLQIQVSENVPPGVWRTSYPEIVRAIKAFFG